VPAWVALLGGLAGLVLVLVRRGLRFERTDAVAGAAVALFVLPVAIHGFANWETASARDPYALTPGLVRFLSRDVPKGAIVYGDLETSYRISAYVPVYVANAPPTHVANTTANRPKKRRRDLNRFLRTHDLAIPRSYGAGWLVLTRGEAVGPGALLVYRDARFRVYRL
jgi:4-amino-4-deoxy-L-arabinose transferase-like glycosyltransferase